MANGGDYTSQEYNEQIYNPNPNPTPPPAGGGGGGGGGSDPWAGYTFTQQMAQAYYNTLTPEQKAQVDAAGGPSIAWLQNAVAAGVPGAIQAAGGARPGYGNQENQGGEAGYTMPWQNALEPEAWLGKRAPTVPELRKWAHYQHQAYLAGDPNAQDEDYERYSDRVLIDQINRGWDVAGGGWKPGWGTPGAGVPGQGPAPGGGGGGKKKPKPTPPPAPPPPETTGAGSTGTEAAPAPTDDAPAAETGGGVTASAPPPPGVTFSAGSEGNQLAAPAPLPDPWASTTGSNAATAAAPPPRVTGGQNTAFSSGTSFFGGSQNRNTNGWAGGSQGWVTSDRRAKTLGLEPPGVRRFSDWRR
jgi:hypothetical protein